jgi:hypothetical protein
VGLLLGWTAIVLLLVYFLEVRPRLRIEAPVVETVPTVQSGFPAPPEGAVVYSRQFGKNVLALGVIPGSDPVIAQASVVGPQGEGVSGLDVSFAAADATVPARSCGSGCYRAALPTGARPRKIDVVVDGASSTRWSVRLPETWPPRDAAQLVAHANRAWRALRSLSFEETIGSGSPRVVRSSWQVEAPDRLTYRIAGGASAVIVGNRRWDRPPGEPWKLSPQSPIRQPTPPWVRATNAFVVRTTSVAGHPADVVTFFDPNTPGWYTIVVDPKTRRTFDVRMVATAHFMHDRMHSFDTTPAIRPPS